jgi:rSAM/selenodomain-associated transferase 1
MHLLKKDFATLSGNPLCGRRCPVSANLLIVFAKTPTAGQVKTRIGAVTGMEAAATIYESMLKNILKESATNEGWHQVIAVTPESDASYFSELGLDLFPQCGSNIGKRMGHALNFGFLSGADRVIVIGSDLPSLTAVDLFEAFSKLETEPCVIGPCLDGGFYLIGCTSKRLKDVLAVLNADISWSTPKVLKEVQALSLKLHCPIFLLPVKQDIDTYDDWVGYLASRNGEK